GADGVAVAVVQLAGVERQPRWDQFVAGRQYRHPQAPVDADAVDAERGEQADIDGTQAMAAGEYRLAGGDVLATVADVFVDAGCLRDCHRGAGDNGVFLHRSEEHTSELQSRENLV